MDAMVLCIGPMAIAEHIEPAIDFCAKAAMST
jgi:hypothetical protein